MSQTCAERQRLYRQRHGDRIAAKQKARYIRGFIKPHLSKREKEAITQMYESGMSFVEIARKTNRNGQTIARFLRSNRFIRPRPVRSGPGSSGWKGGRVLTGNGYAYIWLSSDDPLASMRDKAGRVAEHRLNLARKLGRALLASETVHHIDGDITHNWPENLQLRQGRHGKHIAMCCLDCGSRNVVPAMLES